MIPSRLQQWNWLAPDVMGAQMHLEQRPTLEERGARCGTRHDAVPRCDSGEPRGAGLLVGTQEGPRAARCAVHSTVVVH